MADRLGAWTVIWWDCTSVVR